MEFKAKAHLLKDTCDTLVVGVFEEDKLSPCAQALNESTNGEVLKTLKLANFKAKVGSTVTVFNPSNISADRIVLVGLGHPDKLDMGNFQKAVAGASGQLKSLDAKQIGFLLPEVNVKDRNLYQKVRTSIESLAHAQYSFTQFKSKKDDEVADEAEATVLFESDDFNHQQVETAIQHGQAIAKSVKLVRDLANTPANVCTPTYMADQAKQVTKAHKSIHTHYLSETEMQDLGMGAYLAVSQGSDEPACMIVLEYKGGSKDDKPLAIVGKGVTFDTGGISLKPSNVIMGMKYDMCGAATVLGLIQLAAELELPINLIGVMACVENMPSGRATRPDDVVTTMSGKTVEIANTDAEGRLVLCDALTYVQRFEPAAIVDIATLTGACVVALGRPASGLFANSEELAKSLLEAGQISHDRAWQLPLWEDYQKQLDSTVADMINIGGPEAGTVTAACFLARFTENVPWAHLDVAGTAFVTGKEASASGRPLPLLAQFLLERAKVTQ